jgi:hypothetical protein
VKLEVITIRNDHQITTNELPILSEATSTKDHPCRQLTSMPSQWSSGMMMLGQFQDHAERSRTKIKQRLQTPQVHQIQPHTPREERIHPVLLHHKELLILKARRIPKVLRSHKELEVLIRNLFSLQDQTDRSLSKLRLHRAIQDLKGPLWRLRPRCQANLAISRIRLSPNRCGDILDNHKDHHPPTDRDSLHTVEPILPRPRIIINQS